MKTISALLVLLCCSGLQAQETTCVNGVCFPVVRNVVQRSASVVNRVLPQSVVEHKVETFDFLPASVPCSNANCACADCNCGSFAFVVPNVVVRSSPVVYRQTFVRAQSSVRWNLVYEHEQSAAMVDMMSPAQQEALHNQLHANEQRMTRLFYRPLMSFRQIPALQRVRTFCRRFR